MFKRFSAGLWAVVNLACQLPAEAHVKWFLSSSESELLSLPKPALFCSLRWDNGLIAVAFSLVLLVLYRLNQRLSDQPLNKRLSQLAVRLDDWQQFLIGASTGTLLLYSAWNMTFVVPNLHLHNCCRWVAQSEALIGAAFLFGIFARPAAAALVGLLLFSFVKFQFADCIDLLPVYGIALYIMLAGRGRISLDRLVPLLCVTSPRVNAVACAILRVLVGLGFVLLGFDEKIIHPQLAFNLLQQHPALNFAANFGLGNDVFVLCGGFTEIALGSMIMFGIFPRFAILTLAVLFTITTSIFGKAELIGHLPYYAVFVALFLRGAARSEVNMSRVYQTVFRRPVRIGARSP